MNVQQRREQLAVHESGHACARILLGGEIHYASLYSPSNPHVRVKKVLSEEGERIAILAGVAAEFAFFPAETRHGNFGGDDWDRTESWTHEQKQAAADQARALIKANRSAVGYVADALLARMIVTGEEVERIVKDSASKTTPKK